MEAGPGSVFTPPLSSAWRNSTARSSHLNATASFFLLLHTFLCTYAHNVVDLFTPCCAQEDRPSFKQIMLLLNSHRIYATRFFSSIFLLSEVQKMDAYLYLAFDEWLFCCWWFGFLWFVLPKLTTTAVLCPSCRMQSVVWHAHNLMKRLSSHIALEAWMLFCMILWKLPYLRLPVPPAAHHYYITMLRTGSVRFLQLLLPGHLVSTRFSITVSIKSWI